MEQLQFFLAKISTSAYRTDQWPIKLCGIYQSKGAHICIFSLFQNFFQYAFACALPSMYNKECSITRVPHYFYYSYLESRAGPFFPGFYIVQDVKADRLLRCQIFLVQFYPSTEFSIPFLLGLIFPVPVFPVTVSTRYPFEKTFFF